MIFKFVQKFNFFSLFAENDLNERLRHGKNFYAKFLCRSVSHINKTFEKKNLHYLWAKYFVDVPQSIIDLYLF